MHCIKCVYYTTDTGRVPVKAFISDLHSRTRQKFYVTVELLEKFGKSLPRPYQKHLGKGIYELRFPGIEGKIRVLYFFYHGNTAVFTNGFIKKSERTPKNEIKKAKHRRDLYLRRKNG